MDPTVVEDGGRARTVGRKRDPSLEPRLLSAALEVYAREGWLGLTFDAVARASGVGKPAIYRRWSSREALLVTAFNRTNFPTARDWGSFEGDVRDFVLQWVEWHKTPFMAQAGSRILIDCTSNRDLGQLYNEVVVAPRGTAARQVTRRAIARGEIPADTPPSLMPDLVMGSINTHWAFAPDRDERVLNAHLEDHAERLVQLIVRGLRNH